MVRWVLMEAGLFLVQAGAGAAEHRSPDRMAGFALVELESGVDLQDLAEFLAALALLIGHAIHEREVLVRVDLVALEGEPLVDASLEQALSVLVVAALVRADPCGEVLGRGCAYRPREPEHRARAAPRHERKQQKNSQPSAQHRP